MHLRYRLGTSATSASMSRNGAELPSAPLTAEHLQRRRLPGLRMPGEIAEHIVFGHALHLHRALGAAELTPLLQWGDADDPPHTAAEILHGLELTWQCIIGCLMRGSPTDALPEEEIPIRQTIWGLLDHDLPHAGNCRC